MSQSFQVNNKTYLPSSQLAKQFNYTPDYISKLAREERVLATRVGRAWYIEPESLRTYLQQLDVEKRIAQENLSYQRKREQQTGQSISQPPNNVLIAGQSLAVMVCSLLVGYVTFFAYEHGVTPNIMVAGAKHLGSQLVDKVTLSSMSLANDTLYPVSNVANPLLNRSPKIHSHEKVGPQHTITGTYTQLPDVSNNSVDVSSSTRHLQLPFADEVIIMQTDETLQVRPVFKDRAGKLYELSTTALEEKSLGN